MCILRYTAVCGNEYALEHYLTLSYLPRYVQFTICQRAYPPQVHIYTYKCIYSQVPISSRHRSRSTNVLLQPLRPLLGREAGADGIIYDTIEDHGWGDVDALHPVDLDQDLDIVRHGVPGVQATVA